MVLSLIITAAIREEDGMHPTSSPTRHSPLGTHPPKNHRALERTERYQEQQHLYRCFNFLLGYQIRLTSIIVLLYLG